MTEDIEFSSGSGNCENKMSEKSLSKNSNRAVKYLFFKVRLAFSQLRKAFTKILII